MVWINVISNLLPITEANKDQHNDPINSPKSSNNGHPNNSWGFHKF